MDIRDGFPWYGQKIGVLVFSGTSPRIPGDPGHAHTFSYPVCYGVVEGTFADLIDGSEQIKQHLIDTVTALKAAGVEGIVGDCGLMSLYQDELGSLCGLPVITSSLSLIPFIWNMLGREGPIGVITGHSQLLKQTHLTHSGWTDDIKLVIQGMEKESHFAEIVINGGKHLDPIRMQQDLLSATKKLLEQNSTIRAIILECSNLSSYSKTVYEMTKLPVFDIIAVANLLSYALNPPDYR